MNDVRQRGCWVATGGKTHWRQQFAGTKFAYIGKVCFHCQIKFQLQETLSLFNFGSSIKRWISTFYMNAESCVLNNGFYTDYFMISTGVRQGCPISHYLFLLAAEVLAIKIRQDNRMKGIKIFRTEFKLSLFADDT